MLVKYWKQTVIEGGIKTSQLVPLRLSLDEVFQRWVIVQLQSLENQKRRMINKIKSESFCVLSNLLERERDKYQMNKIVRSEKQVVLPLTHALIMCSQQ